MDLKLTIATAPGESTTVLVECATVEEGLARMHRIIGGMRPPKREPLRDSWCVTGFCAPQLGRLANVPDLRQSPWRHVRKGDAVERGHMRNLRNDALEGVSLVHRRVDDRRDSVEHSHERR